MRLLIANDLDPWIIKKPDTRAWTQRMLWLARDGDVVILNCAPDPEFLRHVSQLTGVNPTSVRFHVVPEGRFGPGNLDPLMLRDVRFLEKLRPDIGEVQEVLAAWPSPHIAEALEFLGINSLWPGHAIFAQGGAEVLNSLGNFRALASASGARISRGEVCRSVDDAVAATQALFNKTKMLMVKKSHGGAGAGNHILTRDPSAETGHAGGKFLTSIDGTAESINRFWEEQWSWASADNTYPVVIEEFQQNARSVYAEFWCKDAGVEWGGSGELIFEQRRLVREIMPPPSLSTRARQNLLKEAQSIAEYYWRLGYRGPLSADSVIDRDDTVHLTEVNAQLTSSTHLHSTIYARLGGADRSVCQLTSPSDWHIRGVAQFLAVVDASGCSYDPATRRGVVAVTPKIGGEHEGHLILAVIYEMPSQLEETLSRLNQAFSAYANAASTPEGHPLSYST